MDERLKKLIFEYLDLITAGSKVYRYPNSRIWIINPNTRIWYVEIRNKHDNCWLWYPTIDEINMMFGINNSDACIVMRQWAEKVIGMDIPNELAYSVSADSEWVNSVINNGVVIKTLGQSDTIKEDIYNDEKLKEVIFKYLNHITAGSKVYYGPESYWIINPETKYWHLELDAKNDHCTLHEDILSDISTIFNLNQGKVIEIIKEWVYGIFDFIDMNNLSMDIIDDEYLSLMRLIVKDSEEIMTLGKSNTITEDIDRNEKLKELIFQYLDLITDGSNIYKLDNDYAIINSEKRYWYVQLYKPHNLFYMNEIVFDEISTMFGLDDSILIEIIKEWIYIIYDFIEKSKLDLKTFNGGASGWIRRNIEKGEVIKTLGQSDTITENIDRNNKFVELIFDYLDTYMGNKTISVYRTDINFGDEFTYRISSGDIKIWKSLPTDISKMFGAERKEILEIIKEWMFQILDILKTTTKSLGYKISVKDAITMRDENELEDLNESAEEQLKPLIFSYWDTLVKDGTFKESDIVYDYDIVDENGKVLMMNNSAGNDIPVNINFFNDIYNLFGIKKEKKDNPFLRPYVNEWGKSIFDNMTDSMKVSDAIKKRDSGNTLNEELNPRLGNVIFEYLNHVLGDKKIMFYHGDYANISDIYPIVDNIEDHIWYLAWDGGSVRVNPKLVREMKGVFSLEHDELLKYIGEWYGILLNKNVKYVHEFKYRMEEVFDFTTSGRFITTVSDLVKVNKPNLSLNENVNDKLEDIILTYIDTSLNDVKLYEVKRQTIINKLNSPVVNDYWLINGNNDWIFVTTENEISGCVKEKFVKEINSIFNIGTLKIKRIFKKWINRFGFEEIDLIDYDCGPSDDYVREIIKTGKRMNESRKIYNLTENINELPTPNLKYYAFDWDDNIVKMPTQIILLTDEDKEIGMSSGDFAKYREYIGKEPFEYKDKTIKDYSERPFINFGSEGDKDFLIDSMLAEPGPSWRDFVEAINNGSIFAIITARGHNPEILKQGVYNYIISNFNGINKNELIKNLKKYRDLSDENEMDDIELIREYLNLCRFYPVSFNNENEKNPEKIKLKVLKEFVNYVKSLVKDLNEKIYIKNNIKNYFNPIIGFSDDDHKNISTVRKHFKDNKTVKTFFTGNNSKES